MRTSGGVPLSDKLLKRLEAMREHGDPVPAPSAIDAFTVVAA